MGEGFDHQHHSNAMALMEYDLPPRFSRPGLFAWDCQSCLEYWRKNLKSLPHRPPARIAICENSSPAWPHGRATRIYDTSVLH
jgi:hypothetical protein